MVNKNASAKKPVVKEFRQGGKAKPVLKKGGFYLVLGGAAFGLSCLFMLSYLSWFCLIPLFLILEKTKLRQSFVYGLIYGAIAALILFYWVVPVAANYSGRFTFHSVFFYGAAVIYYSLYFALFGTAYKLFNGHRKALILSGVSVSAIYVLIESIRLSIFQGMPWFHYNLAVAQAQNLWAIQWTSLGGLHVIIFTIVFFNYLIAQYLITRKTSLLNLAFVILITFYGGGYLLSLNKADNETDKFRAVVLNENFSAETRWNDLTGDSLANVFFSLNEKAVKYKPEMIIWSETAIPWRLESDDDFVPKVLSITYPSKADHLLGILSPATGDRRQVYNSAYLIKYDGRIMDRYDKTILLDFLEKPFYSGPISVLPFLNTSRYDNILSGSSQSVIQSGKALIGVLICNESLAGNMYANYVKEGANLLILMNNDAWFENTMLQLHHFFITRLYAVMMGRDVIVNSNMGITGLIRSDGKIDALPLSNTARIFICEANLHSGKTFYFRIKNITIPIYLLLLFASVFKRRY